MLRATFDVPRIRNLYFVGSCLSSLTFETVSKDLKCHISVSAIYLYFFFQKYNDKKFLQAGTIWSALVHIITAVIGSGVLSLAWSMSQLWWVAGPFTMLAFASVTVISVTLLCNCYNSLDPNNAISTEMPANLTLFAESWVRGLLYIFCWLIGYIAFIFYPISV